MLKLLRYCAMCLEIQSLHYMNNIFSLFISFIAVRSKKKDKTCTYCLNLSASHISLTGASTWLMKLHCLSKFLNSLLMRMRASMRVHFSICDNWSGSLLNCSMWLYSCSKPGCNHTQCFFENVNIHTHTYPNL